LLNFQNKSLDTIKQGVIINPQWFAWFLPANSEAALFISVDRFLFGLTVC